MKLYKVINKDNKSINGGNFDWTDYLPKNNKLGKWTPLIKNIIECKKGYHVTEYPNIWWNDPTEDKIYECEVKGLQENNNIGVIEKYVCKSIRLIKLVNYNSGDSNSGDMNSGDSNSGNKNSGNRNSGDSNSGNKNSGNRNSGDSNSGDMNSGYRNSGYRNSGNWNSGDRNSGDMNSGNWNSGNWNSGSFNTREPEYYELFNKKIEKEIYKNIIFPSYFYFKLLKTGYKESWKESFKNATKMEILQTIKLPNFDYNIFEEITGITKEMIDNRLSIKNENRKD